MPFEVVYGDILEQDVEAIVVPHLSYSDGLMSELTERIYNAAGFQAMAEAHNDAREKAIKEILGRLHCGQTSIYQTDIPVLSVTPGFALKAKHAIHICLPIKEWWERQTDTERKKRLGELQGYYFTTVNFACFTLEVKSVAIPLLGTFLLGFPEDASIEAARQAARQWDNELIWREVRKQSVPQINVCLVVSNKLFVPDKKKPEIAKAPQPTTRPRRTVSSLFDAPPIRRAPPLPKPVAPAPKPAASAYNPNNPYLNNSPKNDFKDDIIDNFKYDDVFAGYENTFENSIKHSGKTKEEFCRTKCAEYLNRIGEPTKLADLLGFHSSVITNFKKAVSAQGGGNIPREKRRVIAIAIYMGLSDYERFEFVRCSGFNYPGEEIDNHVETIIRSGTKAFRYVNKELCKINPDYDLTAPLRKNKPKPEKTR